MTVADIIARLGGASEAAERLGLKRTAILQWRARGQVPPRHVPAVAQALGVAAQEVWPALAAPAPTPVQEAA